MNRLEFLTSLRYNLEKGGLPHEDIEDALSYYEEIFLDSGYGSDEQTASALGTPEDLAREILIDNGIHPDGDAKFEVGEAKKKPYQDVEFEEVGKEENSANGRTNSYGYGYGNTGTDNAGTANSGYSGSQGWAGSASTGFERAASNFGKAVDSAFASAKDIYNKNFNDPSMSDVQKSRRNNNILKILIVILTSPIWIGVVAGIGGTLIGILAAIFSIIISFIAVGVSMIGGGIGMLFEVPPVGIIMIGVGLVLMGIFGLIAKPSFRGLKNLCRLAFDGCKALWKKIAG